MSEGRADRGLSCGILVRNGLRLVLRRWHGLDALKVACYVFQSRPGRIQKCRSQVQQMLCQQI